MKRRDFVTALTATLLGASSAIRLAVIGKYGPMDVDRWFAEGHFGKRVLCNGVDITDGCTFFDDVKGEAVRFVKDSSGNFVMNIDEPLKEMLRGRIEVIG